jgi:lysophospholipase L1-like esterase
MERRHPVWSSYLAIGDSATEGVGDAVGDLECRSWTDLLAEGLVPVMHGLSYRNIARKGVTASVVLREQIPVLEQMRPDFVSITVGANDARVPDWTPEAFRAQFASILEVAVGAGARVMTLAYPDVVSAIERAGHEIPPSWRPYFDRVHKVNEVIRAVGGRYDAWLLDLESLSEAQDLRYFSRDFTHPNALGYLMTAQVALGIVAERLGLPDLADAVRASED